jgi:hypothetical protein
MSTDTRFVVSEVDVLFSYVYKQGQKFSVSKTTYSTNYRVSIDIKQVSVDI